MNCNFIDQLCIENNIDPFYDDIITNKLTCQKIAVAHTERASGKIRNFYTIGDVPGFLEVLTQDKKEALQVKKIPQYKGYLVDLTKFKDVNELFTKTLSKNSRKNFRAKKRNMESTHDISYNFYHGEIDKDCYDHIFETCYSLMEERFHQKKIYNRYLFDWKYYHDLFYSKILSKEASICAIYDKAKPITITLNFHKSDIVFSFIQIYDIDYHKYSLGDIAMYKNLEWSFNNGIDLWDVSKGVTGNKLRWCNHIYQFDYHIFYNPKSLFARLRASLTAKKLNFKQFLRDKGVITNSFQLDRLYYYTKMKKLKNYKWKEDSSV